MRSEKFLAENEVGKKFGRKGSRKKIWPKMRSVKFLAENEVRKIFGRKRSLKNFWPKMDSEKFLAENGLRKIFGRMWNWPKVDLILAESRWPKVVGRSRIDRK